MTLNEPTFVFHLQLTKSVSANKELVMIQIKAHAKSEPLGLIVKVKVQSGLMIYLEIFRNAKKDVALLMVKLIL